MAKKKKSKKRSVSKGVGRPQTAVVESFATSDLSKATDATTINSKPKSNNKVKVSENQPRDPRWGYVGSDVKRVGVISVACTGLLIAIWVLFSTTGIDEQLYSLINL